MNRLLKKAVVGLLVGSMVFSSPVSSLTGLSDGTTIVAEAASTKGVKLSKSSLKLNKGKSYTLKVANASGKKVRWSTKSKRIATVTSKGKVTAKGKGTTYIYAKVGGKTLKCKVTVSVPAPKLSKSSITINKGKSYTLKVSNASSKVRWSVKNKKVATITSKGKVTAKSKGTTYVYARVGKKTLKCKVTVREPAVVRKYTIDSGKSKSLTFSGASSKTKWKSSNSSIVSVSKSKGKKVTVKARKVGKATITATTSGRKTYQFVITVKGKPETLPSKPSTPQTEAPQTETNPPVETEKPLPPQTETNPPQTETNPPQTETNPPQPETPKPPIETEEPVETESESESESETTPEKPPVDPPKKDSNYFYDARILPPPEGYVVNAVGRIEFYPVSHDDGWLDYRFSYSSSDSAIVSIDESGNFRCLSVGSAVLTVKGSDGVVIDKFNVTVTSDTPVGAYMELDKAGSILSTSGGHQVEIFLRTSVSVNNISWNSLSVNNKIPEIEYDGYWNNVRGVAFRFTGWIAGTYNITFTAPNVAPVTVPVTVTSSDPDWVEYNNWLYGKLANEWKADSPLETFLKMGAWLADNRDYVEGQTQFQKLHNMGGDCVASTMLFTDVAERIFKLKAYNSNPGAGHEKAIVEIGNEKWAFDAGFAGNAGVRPFTAFEINRKEQWKYSTEMTADGEVRGWTHRVP